MSLRARFFALAGCLILSAGAGYLYFERADPRLAHLRSLELPEDGLPLFRFLLREIPDVVDSVPCSCCGEMLSACYEGKCPPTCKPCNDEGRDIFAWFSQGKSLAEINRLVVEKYILKKR